MILCGYLGHSARPLAPLVAMSRVVRGWGRLVRRQKRLITPPGGADVREAAPRRSQAFDRWSAALFV